MPERKRTTGKSARDGEDYEDESAVLHRRIDWFRDVLGERDRSLDQRLRGAAVAQTQRLRAPVPESLDPGVSPPRRGYRIETRKGVKATVRRVKNARPRSSFGFAGQPVEVRAGADVRGGTLTIALDKTAERVIIETIRVFRAEPDGEWSLVARSGVNAEDGYAWAQIRRPGVYVPVGFPKSPWLQVTVRTLESYRPWINAARQMGQLPDALKRICNLILCESPFARMLADPGELDKLDLPPFEPGDPAGVCEQCLGLDPPVGGLPESQLLRELHDIRLLPTAIFWPPWWWCSTWISQGPTNVSGRIKSLAIHPTNGSIVYAGSADGGVWKTTNGGASWWPTMSLQLSMAIGALAVSPSSPDIVYAATGEDTPGWGPSYPGVGVYRTSDGGGDWDLVGPLPSTLCTRVLIHPTNPDIVYVAGNLGLHKSTDGGATWTKVRGGHVSDALMDPNAPSTLYVGVRSAGVFKSTDAGGTWTQLANGILAGSAADWIKLAMGVGGTDGTAFLAAKMGTDSGLIFKSSDAGTSWTQLTGTHNPVSYNEWTNLIAVSPSNQDVIFSGSVGFSRSMDGGANFSAIGGTHSDHHQIVFSPTDSDILYMATDGGVYRSNDNGATWNLSSTSLTATQLYSLGVAQTNPLLIGGATQDQGIIRSSGTSTWTDTGAGNEGGFFIVDPNNSNNVYVTPWSGNLRRSTDGAVTWTTILNGLGAPAPTVGHLAVRPGDSAALLCTAGADVFRSTDQGNNWSSVLTPTGTPQQVAYAPSNGAIAYAATSAGRVYRSGGAGAAGSWAEPYAAADAPPAGSVNALIVGWSDPDYVAIGYGGSAGPKVYVSEDGGAHWHDAGGVLDTDAIPDAPITSLALHPYQPETIYAATSIGVFRSRDGGDSWEPFDDGMPRIVTTQLVLRRSSRTLYVSTMGRGAYRRAL